MTQPLRTPHAPARVAALMLSFVLVLLPVLLAGCSSEGSDGSGPDRQRVELIVSAASSLTDVLPDIAEAFEAERPEVDIIFNFASSGVISAQVNNGAPADAVVLAGWAPMEALDENELLGGEPVIVTNNTLVIVTQPDNPERIGSLVGLAAAAAEGEIISLCSENAPCGALARQVLSQAGVELPDGQVTVGQDARATLRAVTEGGAVAGIVYSTDGAGAEQRVHIVPIPGADNVTAAYPAAVLEGAQHTVEAVSFVEYLRSPDAQAIFADAGFLPL